MRIGIQVSPPPRSKASISACVDQIVMAEQDGFDVAWLSQGHGYDSLTMLALAGDRTSKIEMLVGVIPVYPRHPVALAQQALTVAEATGGRLTLGIGLAHPETVTASWGMSYERPAAYMREYLSILMPLLRERRVNFTGHFFSSNVSVPIGPAEPPPVLLAALAPRMLKLAGSIAAGTITWMVGRPAIESHILPKLAAAAQESGGPAPRVCVALPVCVTDDVRRARNAADREFALYAELVNYRRILDIGGAQGPGDVAVIGDEAAVESQLRDLARAGATDFLASIFTTGDAGESAARTRSFLKSIVNRV